MVLVRPKPAPSLDTSTSVKLSGGHLAESKLRGGSLVLRGVLSIPTLSNIRYAQYQRELTDPKNRRDIVEALVKGNPLPDVELGMRGENFIEENGQIVLNDPTYAIDGRQRIGTILEFLKIGQPVIVELGALIHLNTTEQWERERFADLNQKRQAVSPNVLLRNMRHDSKYILTLYGLTKSDKSSLLYGKVSWNQHQLRTELVTARLLARTIAIMHSHLGPTLASNAAAYVSAMDKISETIKLETLRQNINTLFELIDTAWGFSSISYRNMATQIKGSFLYSLATVLSAHTEFWDAKDFKLVVPKEWKDKFAKFNLQDPYVRDMAGTSGGSAQKILYNLLVEHLNKGKQHRLTPRMKDVEIESDEEKDDDD